MSRLRLLLDTNIYGLVIELDPDLVKSIVKCDKVIVYGTPVVRKELRDTPRKKMTEAKRSYRMALLNNFDIIVGHHIIPITKETEELAEEYFNGFKRNKGVGNWKEMKNDFLIVASATLKDLDLVISEDKKTMLSAKAMDSYKIANGKRFLRTPTFFSYEDFKRIVSVCDT